jgi:hypothetical protein
MYHPRMRTYRWLACRACMRQDQEHLVCIASLDQGWPAGLQVGSCLKIYGLWALARP